MVENEHLPCEQKVKTQVDRVELIFAMQSNLQFAAQKDSWLEVLEMTRLFYHLKLPLQWLLLGLDQSYFQ